MTAQLKPIGRITDGGVRHPIGLRVCRVLGQRGATLRLEELDAWPGSPVLDMKPYDERDRVARAGRSLMRAHIARIALISRRQA